MTAPFRLSAILLLVTFLHAEDQPITDGDLPTPFDAGSADELLAHSPFTRIVNLEDTLQLTGIAYVEGKPVATFLNTATKERITVSEEPNSQGWKITEATPGTDPQDTEVHVMIGGEEITMHYGDAQLTPGATRNGIPSKYVARSGSGSSGSRGDDHVRTSSFLGENGRELYASLSREARDKLKEAVHAYVEKHPDQSPEKSSAYAQKLFAKLKSVDQKSPATASPKNIKSGKPGKNK